MLPSEEIKNKINVVDLIGEYVQLKKAGINYRAVCPFHQERTPSFMVSPTKQIWHCFGCGLGGDIFEFVKQMEGVDFMEALRILAPRAGVVLSRQTGDYQKDKDDKKALYEINDLAARFYHKILTDSPIAAAARNYLSGRGFTNDIIAKWQIGWAPEDFHSFETFIVGRGYQKKEALAAGLLSEKDGQYFDRFRGRIMFPLADTHGRIVGFTGRILVEAPSTHSTHVQGGEHGRTTSSGSATGKYVNSPETAIYHKSELLYGLHFAKNEIRRNASVIVVEGNVDVITAQAAGFTNVVGSSGTALTDLQLSTLKRFTDNISFAFDVDAAGLAAARRAVEGALKQGFNVRMVSFPPELGKDPDEVIRKNRAAWEERVAGAENFLDFYFVQTFANIDLTSSLGKKEAVAELLPLIALLPDPIDRAHYLQRLAQETGVQEAILLERLRAATAKNLYPAKAGELSRRRGKTKREVLEARMLGFLLKFGNQIKSGWEELSAEDFSVSEYRTIFENWKQHQPVPEQAEIELLVFAVENELELLGIGDLEEVKNQFLASLKLQTLKQKMNELSARIARAEAAGSPEEVKILSGEFNDLIRELAKYNVA